MDETKKDTDAEGGLGPSGLTTGPGGLSGSGRFESCSLPDEEDEVEKIDPHVGRNALAYHRGGVL